MKIVADERVAALDSTFARHGELVALDGREIGREDLKDADALVVRTVTRVDRDLLEATAVRFVGTATIGSDHLDTAYLEAAGIRWSAAPGCNADATAQYTLAMYLLACRRLGLDAGGRRWGVVGRGNVGGRLLRLLAALDIEAIACDPPLEEQGEAGLCPLEDVLECGVISLHVPLTRSGRWPTRHMLDASRLAQIGGDTLLINTCRGGVIEATALREWMAAGGRAALDVWPGEPDIDRQILDRAVVATPHVAGYSVDGKLRATAMIYRAFCDCFGVREAAEVEPPPGPELDVAELPGPAVEEIVLRVCPVARDDRKMRESRRGRRDERMRGFDALRSRFPLRRDFAAWRLRGQIDQAAVHTVEHLGFSISSH